MSEMGAGDASMKRAENPSEPSVWKRIWHFPLVAMIVGTILAIGSLLPSSFLSKWMLDTGLPEQLRSIILSLLTVIAAFVVYKLAIRRLGGKKHDDLPLDRTALSHTTLGFLGGAVLISTTVGLAALAGVYRIDGPGGFSDWASTLFVAGLYAGFFEELLLRGVIFRWLEELTGSWIALALSALLFGFLHAGNDNATIFSSLAIAIEAGILLGAAYMLTRSLWLAIGLHAGWNVVQGMWDVPISGGDVDGVVTATLEGPVLLAGGGFGLEATVFALLVATSAGVWLAVKSVKAGRIVRPLWNRKGELITAY